MEEYIIYIFLGSLLFSAILCLICELIKARNERMNEDFTYMVSANIPIIAATVFIGYKFDGITPAIVSYLWFMIVLIIIPIHINKLFKRINKLRHINRFASYFVSLAIWLNLLGPLCAYLYNENMKSISDSTHEATPAVIDTLPRLLINPDE